MTAGPLDALIGHDVDMVSFVRDYVEIRVDYSIVRALTEPRGVIDGRTWALADTGSGDTLRRYIGRVVARTEVVDGELLTIEFEDGARFEVSLEPDDRVGPEAAHFVPADERGRLDTSRMCIW